jgi:hypothetical protein
MVTVKTALVTTSCGLMLLGAVAAHAKITTNGVNPNGVSPNGVSPNGANPNGIRPDELTISEPIDQTPGTPLRPGLPLNGLSHSGLGKPAVDARTP